MTKLKILSYNIRGCQSQGIFNKLLYEVARWVKEGKLDVLFAQEHNLNPARHDDLVRQALDKDFRLVINYAKEAPDGSHPGGSLMLIAMKA